MDKLGFILFITAAALAVVAGFLELWWAGIVLAIFGVVVGYMNVPSDGRMAFIVAAVGLSLFSTALDGIPILGSDIIANIMPGFLAFVGGAAFVTALMAVVDALKE